MDQQVETPKHGVHSPSSSSLSSSASHPRKRPGRRTILIGSLIALILLGALGWLTWHLTHPDPAATPAAGGPRGRGAAATTVGVAAVERMDIPVMLEALGTVIPAANVTVRPQVGGVLKQIHFKEGQTVKAGDLLATIDPRQFEMALMQASATRQRNEAQLESARVTLQRFRTLLEQDSIARQEVDTQSALVKQLEGTVKGDRASEGVAKLNLGYSRVVAPISGRVGLRVVDVGNVVGANDAGGIAVITQVSPIDVQFSVPQDQVPEIQARVNEGAVMPVTALDRTRANTLDAGRFLTLDNQIDTQTGTVRAKARFDNAKLMLFPNQFVNVRLLLRTIQGGLMVPVTAVRRGANGDFVYVLNTAERTANLRLVKRGQATVDKVEITSGLQFGERVITEGADRLKDGAKVTLSGDKPQAAGAGRSGRTPGTAAAGGGAGKEGRRRPAADGTAAPAVPGTPGASPSAPSPSISPPAPAGDAQPAAVPGAAAPASDGATAPAPGQRRRAKEAAAQ